ncbi:hypothetical protein BDR07DRAFT_1476784 [Suillus spraguei]|nr:hypothetical protein BDR07DRAFT_1476784 [Suillus spraguei]
MFNASHPIIDIVTDRTTHAIHEPPGAILVSVFIQFFFQGIIVIEAGQYYEVCYEDSWGRNLFVAFVTLLSLAQTAFEGYIAWKANVDSRPLLKIPRAWFALFLNGFISGTNKLFLLRRCWRVTKGSWWIPVLFAFTITTYVANILIAVAFSRLDVVNPKPSDVVLSVVAFSYWTTAVLVLDVIFSVILAFFLWKNKTGMHHLDRALLRFCAVATESAVWPSLCVAVAAGLFFSHNVSANSSRHTNKTDLTAIYPGRRQPPRFRIPASNRKTLHLVDPPHIKRKSAITRKNKSDEFARGSLGNWSWRQADSGMDDEMFMSATNERSSFRAATSGRLLSIAIGPTERSAVDGRAVLDQHLRSPMPIHSNPFGSRSTQ